jgi:hypothetical protein
MGGVEEHHLGPRTYSYGVKQQQQQHRREKHVMMLELGRLCSQHHLAQQEVRAMSNRLKAIEARQEQILEFLAKAMCCSSSAASHGNINLHLSNHAPAVQQQCCTNLVLNHHHQHHGGSDTSILLRDQFDEDNDDDDDYNSNNDSINVSSCSRKRPRQHFADPPHDRDSMECWGDSSISTMTVDGITHINQTNRHRHHHSHQLRFVEESVDASAAMFSDTKLLLPHHHHQQQEQHSHNHNNNDSESIFGIPDIRAVAAAAAAAGSAVMAFDRSFAGANDADDDGDDHKGKGVK